MIFRSYKDASEIGKERVIRTFLWFPKRVRHNEIAWLTWVYVKERLERKGSKIRWVADYSEAVPE